MNISRRELRSINVYNPIIYGALFTHLSFAVAIRVQTSFVYVYYGFVSILGYWGTKKITVLSLLSRSCSMYVWYFAFMSVSLFYGRQNGYGYEAI